MKSITMARIAGLGLLMAVGVTHAYCLAGVSSVSNCDSEPDNIYSAGSNGNKFGQELQSSDRAGYTLQGHSVSSLLHDTSGKTSGINSSNSYGNGRSLGATGTLSGSSSASTASDESETSCLKDAFGHKSCL